LLQAVEALRGDRLVDGAPPDRVFRARLVNDVFVARRAAGMPPGVGNKRTAEPKLAFPARHRVFVEMRGRQVPMHHSKMAHSLFAEVEAGHARGYSIVRLVQASLLRRPPGGSGAGRCIPNLLAK